MTPDQASDLEVMRMMFGTLWADLHLFIVGTAFGLAVMTLAVVRRHGWI